MAISSGNDYTIDLKVPNVKLSELNHYRISDGRQFKSDLSDLMDVQFIDLDELSYVKDDPILELNRMIGEYTGTLLVDKSKGLDFNKLLPSDLELFSTNTTNSEEDNSPNDISYNKYNRAVHISHGIYDILKIQLNCIKLNDFNEYSTDSIVELYKNRTLVMVIKYVPEEPKRGHIITLSSQYDTDVVSSKLHEAEDDYTKKVSEEIELHEPKSRYFSTGKGNIHYKVSDCNISYVISDSTKNILSNTYINNLNTYLGDISSSYVETNSMIFTKQGKKFLIGVPTI